MMSKWLRNAGIIALLAGLSAPTVFAGELKTALAAAEKKAEALDKSVDSFAGEAEKMVSNTWQMVQTGSGGVDELYLYVSEKLKKDGKTWDGVKNDPIQSVSDGNVQKFMQGIAEFQTQAIASSDQWKTTGTGLQQELDALQEDLEKVNKALEKRKGKLLKSKKYKDKLKAQELALGDLLQKTNTIEAALKDLRSDANSPPSANQIKATLEIKPADPLSKLDNMAAISVKSLVKQYSNVKSSGEKSVRKFREAGDFSGELKLIKEMVKDAEDMEKESD